MSFRVLAVRTRGSRRDFVKVAQQFIAGSWPTDWSVPLGTKERLTFRTIRLLKATKSIVPVGTGRLENTFTQH
jgi:hypothetical protein